MQQNWRRVFSFLLCLLMLSAVMPVYADTTEPTTLTGDEIALLTSGEGIGVEPFLPLELPEIEEEAAPVEESAPAEEAPVVETAPAYPWEAMTDSEFAAYIRANRDYIRGILNGADSAALASFNARLGAVVDEDVYFQLVAELAEAAEPSGEPKEEKSENETEPVISAYPWDGMTDEEFAEWAMADENRDNVYAVYYGTDETARVSFSTRLEAVQGENLYFEFVAYIAGLEKMDDVIKGEELMPRFMASGSNIIINGVDIGYANGSYFTKNGNSCRTDAFANGRCHKNGINCEISTDPRCNCMRYWPTGYKSTCQVDLGGSQCFGFARYCQWRVYGVLENNTDYRYVYNPSNDAASLKAALLGCPAAAHIRNKSYPHSWLIVSTSETGATVAECNTDGYCKVTLKEYTWANLASDIQRRGAIDYISIWKGSNPPVNEIDHRYDSILPITCKANTSGKVTVYDIYRNAYSLGSAWIDGANDVCTIHEVYTDGFCKVTYPTSKGPRTEYARLSDFDLSQTRRPADLGTNFVGYIIKDHIWRATGVNDWDELVLMHDVAAANQLWGFERQGDGSYKIVSCQDGRVLTAPSGTYDTGVVHVEPSNDSPAQRWFIYSDGGAYSIKPASSDLYMDVYDNGIDDGAWVGLYGYHGGEAQIFAIYNAQEHLTPSELTLTYSNSRYTLNWTTKSWATYYNLRIFKDVLYDGEDMSMWGLRTNQAVERLPAGHYFAYVDTLNECVGRQSNIIEFDVTTVIRPVNIYHWLWGMQNGEGNNGGTNPALILRQSTYDVDSGQRFTFDEGKILPAPNGIRFSGMSTGSPLLTGATDGSWKNFPIGLSFVQDESYVGVEFGYVPEEYKITYQLNGGTNAASNPSKYTVFYGVTLSKPTRDGFTFVGWKDQNGNIITGINEGKDMSFTAKKEYNYDAIYSELATRRTGDITLTAVWQENDHRFGAWTGSENNHWRECSLCGTKEEAEHIYDGFVCVVCGWQKAKSGMCGTNAMWELREDGTLIISGTGATTAYANKDAQPWAEYREQITALVVESGITKLNNYLLHSCATLESISIPNTVTALGTSAFSGCKHLTSVELPDSITMVSSSGFYGCTALESITLPANIKTIPGNFLYNCRGLKSVTIPESVTSVGNLAFNGCTGLSEIELPAGLTSLGNNTFAGCTGLKTITFTGDAPTFGTTPFGGTNPVEATVYYDGHNSGWDTAANQNYGGKLTWTKKAYQNNGTCGAKVNWSLDSNGTLTISGTGAMTDYNPSGSFFAPWNDRKAEIKKVVISSGVTHLGVGSFYQCALTSVTIPSSVTSIGDVCFSDCASLTSVTIPSSVTSLGKSCFNYCTGLKTVSLSTGLTALNEYAFRGCTSLTSVTVPANVKTLGYGAFFGCSGLNSVTLSKGVTTLDTGCFYGCSGLMSITLPDTVTTIGQNAFRSCSGLQAITVPAAVTSIGSTAFGGCTGMKTVEFKGNAPTIASDAFKDVAATVSYPSGASGWGTAANKNYGGTLTWGGGSQSTVIASGTCGTNAKWSLTSDGTLTISGSGTTTAFSKDAQAWSAHRSKITALVVESGITKLNTYLMQGCTELQTVSIANTVTSLASSIFNGCSKLTSVELPDSITAVGSSDFYGCTALTSVKLPANVKSYPTYFFYNCKNLKSVEIPAAATTIGNNCFYGCSALKDVTFLGNAPTITETGNAFKGVTATIHYDSAKTGWATVANKNYGGTLTWVSGGTTVKFAITSQPANVTASAGQTATFAVKAEGTGLTYQWQSCASSSASWVNSTAAGSKTSTLSVDVTAAMNGYSFRCVITDANGAQLTSNAATLTVTVVSKVEIQVQPMNIGAKAGAYACFTVVASGDGLTYTWQQLSGGKWSNVASTVMGQGDMTLNPVASAALNGAQFRCVVRDANGNEVISDAATLTVY